MVENYRIVWLTVPCVENLDRDLQEVGKEDGRKAWKSPTGLCKEDGRKSWKSPTGPSEKDKEFFEDKLSSSAAALDNLYNQMKTLSLRFESSEETVGNCKRELKELSIEKEEREKYFRDEQCKTTNVIEEKDAMIKHLEATVSITRLDMESLNSNMEELHADTPHEDGGQGEDEGHEEELGRDEDDDNEEDEEESGTEDVEDGDEFSKEP
ncbi:Synaptonemal complex protein 1 [Camellia lanceoleosa]|uniref:Synaptonemal complex protein 1 n=1 Tax=Camellia lanceoleosa TaxID=1840588 RepID=A0ACC0IWR9_9ERIC|nr:Synaptonemal complex protein 1 [Camellia lanceoleosa]